MMNNRLFTTLRNLCVRHYRSLSTVNKGELHNWNTNIFTASHLGLCKSQAELQKQNDVFSQNVRNLELHLTASLLVTSCAEANTNISIEAPCFRKLNLSIGDISECHIPAILDPSVSVNLIGDLVPDKESDTVGDNPDSLHNLPEYKARHIQKIRRWRMNRHKLKRLRRRMKMVYRKRNFQQKKKKEARLKAVIDAIKLDGERFDALEFVKGRLELAKNGGFVQDIWKSTEEQPGVPWKGYSVSNKKIRTYETKVKPPKFITKKRLRELKKLNRLK